MGRKEKDKGDPKSYGLSEHTVGTGGGVVIGMKPSETRWAIYNPKAPYDIKFDAKKAEFKKHTFTDVSAAGFFVAKDA